MIGWRGRAHERYQLGKQRTLKRRVKKRFSSEGNKSVPVGKGGKGGPIEGQLRLRYEVKST